MLLLLKISLLPSLRVEEQSRGPRSYSERESAALFFLIPLVLGPLGFRYRVGAAPITEVMPEKPSADTQQHILSEVMYKYFY